MPPRKSDVRASTPIAAEETSPPAKPQQEKKDKDKEKDAQKAKGDDAITIEVCACVYILRIFQRVSKHKSLSEKANFCFSQDLNLPKSIITRLAKGTLPPNTQIQGNAILALSKSATVFISYLASQYVLSHETLHVIYFGGLSPPFHSYTRNGTNHICTHSQILNKG